jgi:hypothetical protein
MNEHTASEFERLVWEYKQAPRLSFVCLDCGGVIPPALLGSLTCHNCRKPGKVARPQ